MFGTSYRRVQRGVKLLDQEIPGWEQFIDAHKLDLAKSNKCILGQLYSGNYQMGEAVLFGRDHSDFQASRLATKHGLDRGFVSGYTQLTREWRRLILVRQYDSMALEEACPAKAKAQVQTQAA